jgi:triacylglycerol lipase
VVHLRPARMAKDDEAAGSVITITRPRGYFGHGRDIFTIDGKTPPGVNEGVPGVSTGKLALPAAAPRAVPVRFNLESFAVQSWPVAEKRLVIAEFHY